MPDPRPIENQPRDDAELRELTARTLHAFAFGYDPNKQVIAQGTLWDGFMDDEREPFYAQADAVLAAIAAALTERGRVAEREQLRAGIEALRAELSEEYHRATGGTLARPVIPSAASDEGRAYSKAIAGLNGILRTLNDDESVAAVLALIDAREGEEQ